MSTFQIHDPAGNNIGIIQEWFPKLIFRSDNLLPANYVSKLISITKTIVDENNKTCTALNVRSTHLTNNLIQYAEYNMLQSNILSCVKGFGEALGYCLHTQMQNLQIANMWANSSVTGDFIFPHVHSNSDFSGVYYLEAPADSTITFYDNIYNMSKEAKNQNIFNAKYTQYPCTPNSLLLFKSNLLHGNEKQPLGNKLAISFNIVF